MHALVTRQAHGIVREVVPELPVVDDLRLAEQLGGLNAVVRLAAADGTVDDDGGVIGHMVGDHAAPLALY